MKNHLRSFAYLLPIVELLVAAMIVIVPAVLSFIHFKQVAHGSASVSFQSGDYVFTIPSDRFLVVGFDRAGWRAERPITILNTPAKFTETLMSLAIARKGYWWPPSLLQSTWHAIIYPIYALPAWIYIGFGIDALIGRHRVRLGNVILSVLLILTCASLFCGLRFGMPAAEREGRTGSTGSSTGLRFGLCYFAFLLWHGSGRSGIAPWLRTSPFRHSWRNIAITLIDLTLENKRRPSCFTFFRTTLTEVARPPQ